MWQRLTRHRIDETRWDACVEKSPHRQVYALSWYMDAVCPGWEGWVWPGAEGSYQAVMPVPVRRKGFFRYVAQPPFTQQLGWFGTLPATQTPAVVAAQLTRAFRLVAYALHEALPPPPSEGGRRVVVRQTAHLRLDQSHADICRGYNKGIRSNLRVARRAGLTVAEAPDALPDLVALFCREKGQVVRAGEWPKLFRLAAAARQRGAAVLYVARSPDGSLQAGALFITYHDRVIYLFGVSAPSGRDNGGMTLLIDHCLRLHAAKHYRIFDFEGSRLPGVARFFSGFGVKWVSFGHVTSARLPAPLRWWRRWRQRAVS